MLCTTITKFAGLGDDTCLARVSPLQYPNTLRYDLVFMDLQMLGMESLEATRQSRAFKAGMDDHIGKPPDFDEVLKKLKKYWPRNVW